MMKRMLILILAIAFSGCAGMQLPPDAQKVIPIQDTTSCRFITERYIETERYDEAHPEPLINAMKWYTYRAGGNAYKVISQVVIGIKQDRERVFPPGKPVSTHIEIYRCEP